MAVESRQTTGLVFLVAAFFCLISQTEAGSYCISGYSSTYCSSGCCGSAGSEYCCNDATTWLIVGCVLGGLFLVSVIVVVVCIVIKKKGKPGRVVQPTTQPGHVTVVYAGGSGPYPGPPPPYGAQPMGAQPIPPPSYPYGAATTTSTTPAGLNYSIPAYPPPPPKAY